MKIEGKRATLSVGATGNAGDLVIRDSKGRNALVFDGDAATLRLGSIENDGDLVVTNGVGKETARLDGNTGTAKIDRVDPYGDSLHVDAKYLRIHGADLMLDGRSGGNKRALVDNTNRLVVNYNNDYSKGVEIKNLHLSDHIKGVVWEDESDYNPGRNKWSRLYRLNTKLKATEWDFVSMCEIGMRDKGSVKNFWWEARYVPQTNRRGHYVINWEIRYRDNGTDWFPTYRSVFWLAWRK